MKDHLRALPANRSDLTRVSILGHDNASAYTEQLRCVRYRLSMIACRSRRHAPLALGGSKLRDEVDTTAHFESSGGIVILMLNEHARANELVESGIFEAGRTQQIRRDSFSCEKHIIECGRLL